MNRKSPLTILVAEAAAGIRSQLKLFLEKKEYRVVEATNGLEVVSAALGERPDLILMSVVLPLQSGIAAIYKIREHAELREAPIVAMTAYPSTCLHHDAAVAGCADYLTQPIDFAQLENLLRRHFDERREAENTVAITNSGVKMGDIRGNIFARGVGYIRMFLKRQTRRLAVTTQVSAAAQRQQPQRR